MTSKRCPFPLLNECVEISLNSVRKLGIRLAFKYRNGLTQRSGARGVSLMFSSGDGGVGDGDDNPATQRCFTNDGRNKTEFIPAFPAS